MDKLFYCLSVSFLIAFCTLAVAQPPLRKEIPLNDHFSQCFICPLGENGLLVVHSSAYDSDPEKINWVFYFFDTAFNQKFCDSIPVPYLFSIQKSAFDNKNVLLLFSSSDIINDSELFYLIKFDSENLSLQIVPLSFSFRWKAEWIWIRENQVFLSGFIPPPGIANAAHFAYSLTLIPYFTSGSLLKYIPVLIDLNTVSNQFNIIKSPYFVNDSWISGPYADTIANRYLFPLLSVKNKQSRVDILDYRSGSIPQIKYSVLSKPDVVFHSARILADSSNTLFLCGAYLSRKKARSAQSLVDTELKTKGFYYLPVDTNSSQYQARYIPLHELNSYYYFFQKSKLHRISRKVEKLKKYGKEPDYHFNLNFYKSVFYKRYLILGGENTTEDVFFQSKRPSPEVPSMYINGYRHSNIFLIIIDPYNDKIRDMGMLSKDLFSGSRDILSASLIEDDEAGLMYYQNGRVFAQFDMLSNSSSYKNELDVFSLYNQDRVDLEIAQGVIHWYGTVFIVYGVQIINNPSLKGKRQRLVFFLNKFAIE